MSIYIENGYDSRMDYLESLAVDYGVPCSHVVALASLLGKDEDFDGLVTALEDMSEDFDK